MPKVIYDFQIFCWQRYGGISRYFYELIIRLSKSDALDIDVLAGGYMNEYLKQCSSKVVKGLHVPRLPKLQRTCGIINTAISKFSFQYNPPDIVHETFYSLKPLTPSKSKIVITIHDMLPEKFPHLFGNSGVVEAKKACVNRADRIICVSKNTKKDLIEILDVDPAKITVVYHGSSFGNNVNTSEVDTGIVEPYIFYVGGRNGHKNFTALLDAYGNTPQLRNNFQLVCFGGDAISQAEINRINSLGLSENKVIRIAGSDRLLASLYQQAAAFIYPALYEGFGIPLLEAMSLGCPVICSNTSCFPEVADNGAEYFDPHSVESIAHALERVLFSTELSNNLIKAGNERVKLFTWDNCAAQTQKVYQSLI